MFNHEYKKMSKLTLSKLYIRKKSCNVVVYLLLVLHIFSAHLCLILRHIYGNVTQTNLDVYERCHCETSLKIRSPTFCGFVSSPSLCWKHPLHIRVTLTPTCDMPSHRFAKAFI